MFQEYDMNRSRKGMKDQLNPTVTMVKMIRYYNYSG